MASTDSDKEKHATKELQAFLRSETFAKALHDGEFRGLRKDQWTIISPCVVKCRLQENETHPSTWSLTHLEDFASQLSDGWKASGPPVRPLQDSESTRFPCGMRLTAGLANPDVDCIVVDGVLPNLKYVDPTGKKIQEDDIEFNDDFHEPESIGRMLAQHVTSMRNNAVMYNKKVIIFVARWEIFLSNCEPQVKAYFDQAPDMGLGRIANLDANLVSFESPFHRVNEFYTKSMHELKKGPVRDLSSQSPSKRVTKGKGEQNMGGEDFSKNISKDNLAGNVDCIPGGNLEEDTTMTEATDNELSLFVQDDESEHDGHRTPEPDLSANAEDTGDEASGTNTDVPCERCLKRLHFVATDRKSVEARDALKCRFSEVKKCASCSKGKSYCNPVRKELATDAERLLQRASNVVNGIDVDNDALKTACSQFTSRCTKLAKGSPMSPFPRKRRQSQMDTDDTN